MSGTYDPGDRCGRDHSHWVEAKTTKLDRLRAHLPDGYVVSPVLAHSLLSHNYNSAYHALKDYPEDFDAFAYVWRACRIRYTRCGLGRAKRFAQKHGLRKAR